MDGILDRAPEALAFIDALRTRGAQKISFARLVVEFTPAPVVLDLPEQKFQIPEAPLSPEELDALLYAETTRL